MRSIYQNEALDISFSEELVSRSFVVKNCEKGSYLNFSELGKNLSQSDTSSEASGSRNLGQPTTSSGARG